mgnify:CR=1 FL=1
MKSFKTYLQEKISPRARAVTGHFLIKRAVLSAEAILCISAKT